MPGVSTNIKISIKPKVSTSNPTSNLNKTRNYDLVLDIEDASGHVGFDPQNELIQANNVPVFDDNTDIRLAEAIKGFFEYKTTYDPDKKEDVDSSYVGIMIGEV